MKSGILCHLMPDQLLTHGVTELDLSFRSMRKIEIHSLSRFSGNILFIIMMSRIEEGKGYYLKIYSSHYLIAFSLN